MVCALEAHNSEPSLKRKRAALLLEHRFAKKQHTMATCATHCDGQEWCSVSMRNYAMWITEIAQHVHSSFASGVLYSGVVDRRLGDPSTYQVMVVETEAGLRNGLAMLEESTTDKVMAMDLEWRPDDKYESNPVALIQIATPGACLLIRTRYLRRNDELPPALEEFFRRHTVIGFAWDRCDDDKLRETFGVGREVFGQLIDVQEVARRLGYVRTGLANLAQTILRYSLTKDKWITRSDWDARSLNAKQLRYGAMDAVVTAALYRTLRSLHNEPIPCETCEELLGVEPAELLHVGPVCEGCGRRKVPRAPVEYAQPAREGGASSSQDRYKRGRYYEDENNMYSECTA